MTDTTTPATCNITTVLRGSGRSARHENCGRPATHFVSALPMNAICKMHLTRNKTFRAAHRAGRFEPIA